MLKILWNLELFDPQIGLPQVERKQMHWQYIVPGKHKHWRSSATVIKSMKQPSNKQLQTLPS